MANYAVIGAGWAGCSAAVELSKRGHRVQLFETARTLGGRARQLISHGMMLDNGQHILLGAYRSTLELLTTTGIDPKTALLRLPLQMCYPPESGGMHFVAPRLPAPLHLALALWNATGLNRADKLALARFSSTARWMDWQLNTDCTVAELLARFDQTDNLIRLMWQPLCVAALNTPVSTASAQVFLSVLKDSLGAHRAASDMLIPRYDLSSLLPLAAANYIEQGGGQVYPGCAIHKLQYKRQWQLHTGQDTYTADGVIIATPARTAAALLAPLSSQHGIPEFSYKAITTCYLKYPAGTTLARPFYALQERPEHAAFGQFVFDRGQLNPQQAGLLAVVISAPAITQDHTTLAQALAAQLAADLHKPALAHPEWSQTITEKRATFACTPGLHRPQQKLTLPELEGCTSLALAGDYTASPYPATLEAAVQSGIAAAKAVLQTP